MQPIRIKMVSLGISRSSTVSVMYSSRSRISWVLKLYLPCCNEIEPNSQSQSNQGEIFRNGKVQRSAFLLVFV